MKMPERIEAVMLAPYGVNCALCYRHVTERKRGKPCGGCLAGDEGKTEYCRNCQIKFCA